MALVALLAITTEARLKVLSPASLADQFRNSTIRANYANFGFVPYGQTIMGKMHYEKEDSYTCEEFPDDFKLARTDDISSFMVARRGECSFVQKVRNMENAGVAVAIIVDNRAEMIDEVLMSDDGTGGGIRIPSMLIGSNDGDKLMNWFVKATPEERDSLILMCEFIMPEHENVSLDFWFTSSSDRAIDFLEDFTKIEKSLGKKLEFRPRYVFWECKQCDAKYLESDCFGGGRYCAVESSNTNIKGRDILLEDVRQMCLWSRFKDSEPLKWWKYIQRVHSTCYSVINEDCSERAHEFLNLDWDATNACVRESFGGANKNTWGDADVHNSRIDEEIAYWKDYGTNIYPSIVIN